MVGLAYQTREVSSMVREKESAVSSKVVMGNPSLMRCNSATENQKTCQIVMILAWEAGFG